MDPRVGIGKQGFVDHDRAEVAAPDTDVDHVGDLLARDPAPLSRPHAVGEVAEAVEHLVHVVVDLLPVDDEGGLRAGGATEGRVQHGAVFAGVQVRPAQHVGEALAHAGLVGQRQQSVEHVGGDEVLRQVDVQIAHRARQGAGPIVVGGEPAAQIGLELVAQSGEAGPGGGGGGVDRRSHGSHASDPGDAAHRG